MTSGIPLPPDDKPTSCSLESSLWAAANVLRGPVDASDFKAHIFPLLFLKLISDACDEERAPALGESNGDQKFALLPEEHRLRIPESCHWQDLRMRAENIGQVVAHAMQEIETANPSSRYGIFGTSSGPTRNGCPIRQR